MIKIDTLSKDELNFYAREIADAFISEPGCFSFMSLKDATSIFKILLEAGIENKSLYATSANMEAFLMCWRKKDKPGSWIMTKFIIKMLTRVPLRVLLKIGKSQSNWKDLESVYKKANDYLFMHMICIRKEYQHQGLLKEIMSFGIKLAKDNNTLAILDTDSELKKNKYMRYGMRLTNEAKQKSGITMYALESI